MSLHLCLQKVKLFISENVVPELLQVKIYKQTILFFPFPLFEILH